jgi:hypothetical protein
MQSRTSHSYLTFRQPFRLSGMDSIAPAGRYRVDLEEERLDSLTVEVWRQTAAILQITSTGITEYIIVTPQELRAALSRDSETGSQPAVPSPVRTCVKPWR